MVRKLPAAKAKKTEVPTPKKGPKVTVSRGMKITHWIQIKNDHLSAGIPEGETCAARVRQIDSSTFYCYRDGHYLGSAKTLDDAKRKTAAREMSEINDRVRAWEKEHPGEVPPFLQLTEAERKAYRHHNPPRPGAAASASASKRPAEDPATRALREQLALAGGKGARAAKKAAEASLSGRMVRLKDGNPKKPGSAPHGRWALMFEHADKGALVSQFLANKGNPTTLENAIKAGWVRLEQEGK